MKFATRFRKRSNPEFNYAVASLGQAFETEVTRQQNERIIYARALALYDRDTILRNANPISWPSTMVQPMAVYRGPIGQMTTVPYQPYYWAEMFPGFGSFKLGVGVDVCKYTISFIYSSWF